MRRTDLNQLLILLFLGISLTLLSGCFNVKHLPKGTSLYTGADVKIADDPKGKNSKALQTELQGLIRPLPNSKILGLQPALWLWSISKPNKKGLQHLLHDKWGQPPVLFNPQDLVRNKQILVNRMSNEGYFVASAKSDSLTKDHKTHVTYTAFHGPQYHLNRIQYPDPDSLDELSTAVSKAAAASLLKPGAPYNLGTITSERSRIDGVLKNEGFFYFSPDFLLVQADSTLGKHIVNLNVVIKDETPDKAGYPYKIGQSYVYPNYTLDKAAHLKKDTGYLYQKGVHFIDSTHSIRPGVVENSIFLKQGDTYNIEAHNITLSRLVNLGVYKFVKVQYEDADTSASNRTLNGYYYLTPNNKYSLNSELTGSSKSNNYEGGILKFTFRDRNFNHTGNLFTLSAYGGFEVQVSGDNAGSGNSFLYGATGDLYVPRFVTPFFHVQTTNAFVPKTRYSLGFSSVSRGGLYNLNSGTFLFGYIWKESAYKEHNLYPISITYVTPSGITRQFQDSVLNVNPFLKRSFEAQFFLGSTYSYTYTDQTNTNLRNTFYFNGSVDGSGNLIGLIQGKSDTTSAHQNKIFRKPYAQYVKLEFDTRDYFKVTPGLTWANRIDIGIGYTHGNSSSLPYVKAFFSGGSNSIRAFRARSLGPGSYYKPPDSNSFTSDEPGDIKLEANTELRANLFSIVKGAAFIDAGNVWLLHEDPSRPGSKFSKSFANQIAVGTGLGLRIDVSFFVLRLDVAFPLRVPYNPEGQRWVINKIDFGSSSWRANNLVYNIAIGYPF